MCTDDMVINLEWYMLFLISIYLCFLFLWVSLVKSEHLFILG
jgi:hypothetical protein